MGLLAAEILKSGPQPPGGPARGWGFSSVILPRSSVSGLCTRTTRFWAVGCHRPGPPGTLASNPVFFSQGQEMTPPGVFVDGGFFFLLLFGHLGRAGVARFDQGKRTFAAAVDRGRFDETGFFFFILFLFFYCSALANTEFHPPVRALLGRGNPKAPNKNAYPTTTVVAAAGCPRRGFWPKHRNQAQPRGPKPRATRGHTLVPPASRPPKGHASGALLSPTPGPPKPASAQSGFFLLRLPTAAPPGPVRAASGTAHSTAPEEIWRKGAKPEGPGPRFHPVRQKKPGNRKKMVAWPSGPSRAGAKQ